MWENIGEIDKFLVVIAIVIITFTSLALEGIHRRQLKPVRVFTCSQGNLEAKGNLDN